MNIETLIIVIVGPTASGKSDAGVLLAKKIKGSVLSADSRQVYKGLNVGSGKISKKEMSGIPHYGLDIVSLKKNFTANDFKIIGEKAIKDTRDNKRTPIIVGGTGFYIDTLLRRIETASIPPSPKLRKRLSSYNAEKLFSMLTKIDPKRAKSIDRHNPHRLIRAIEIATSSKHPKATQQTLSEEIDKKNIIWIGISPPKIILHQRIHKRLLKRLDGIIQETKKLHTTGTSWKRLYGLGLEYRYASLYLRKKINKEEMRISLESEIRKYAKRQMTWFKRNKDIHWVSAPSLVVPIMLKKLK